MLKDKATNEWKVQVSIDVWKRCIGIGVYVYDNDNVKQKLLLTTLVPYSGTKTKRVGISKFIVHRRRSCLCPTTTAANHEQQDQETGFFAVLTP